VNESILQVTPIYATGFLSGTVLEKIHFKFEPKLESDDIPYQSVISASQIIANAT
jgi:hypothetical protein